MFTKDTVALNWHFSLTKGLFRQNILINVPQLLFFIEFVPWKDINTLYFWTGRQTFQKVVIIITTNIEHLIIFRNLAHHNNNGKITIFFNRTVKATKDHSTGHYLVRLTHTYCTLLHEALERQSTEKCLHLTARV